MNELAEFESIENIFGNNTKETSLGEAKTLGIPPKK